MRIVTPETDEYLYDILVTPWGETFKSYRRILPLVTAHVNAYKRRLSIMEPPRALLPPPPARAVPKWGQIRGDTWLYAVMCIAQYLDERLLVRQYPHCITGALPMLLHYISSTSGEEPAESGTSTSTNSVPSQTLTLQNVELVQYKP